MKKILATIVFVAALSVSAMAQFNKAGVRFGVGTSHYADNLSTSSPIMGMNLGAFINLGFSEAQSMFMENFSLQTGLNFNRRGTNFEELYEKDLFMQYREGSYHDYYVQLPIMGVYRYELPIRQAGHYLLLSAGPAVSFGVFGRLNDRKISPYLPQRTQNYDVSEDSFKTQDRLDVDVILSVGYERNDLSLSLQLDYGFLAVSKSSDVLRLSEGSTAKQSTIPGGNNVCFTLCVGYQIPLR